MPSGFAALDTGFPNLSGYNSTEEKLKAMEDYLVQLLEQLRYTLHNISVENMNTPEVTGWLGEVITEPIQAEITDVENGLSTRIDVNAQGIQTEVTRATAAEGTLGTRITQTADAVTAEASRATGAEAQLRLTAEGLATRVTNAEGDISTLEQTATGLRTDVNAASGAASTAQQTANGIKAQVTDAQGNYTVLNLKSDGLHVGNASGATTISGANITTGTINAAQLNSGAVTADKIESGAITTEKLHANAVTAGKIASGTITSNEIHANTITLGNLSSAVTNSFGDANPAYIKNTYIDATQVSAPLIRANDFEVIVGEGAHQGGYYIYPGTQQENPAFAVKWYDDTVYTAPTTVISMPWGGDLFISNRSLFLSTVTEMKLGTSMYGSSLPASGSTGQLFFKI